MFILTDGRGAELSLEFTKIFDGDYGDGKECAFLIKGKSAFLQFEKRSYSTMGTFKRLFERLSAIYEKCSGAVHEKFSYEEDFALDIVFGNFGHVVICAHIIDRDEFGNECKICFVTDQTYIKQFLSDLKYDLEQLQ